MNSRQVVLITGALTGIGRATALAFAKDGASIVVSGRRDEASLSLADEICGLGAEAEFIRTDVRREDEVRNLIDNVLGTLLGMKHELRVMQAQGRAASSISSPRWASAVWRTWRSTREASTRWKASRSPP